MEVPGIIECGKVGEKGHWELIQPTTSWQAMDTPLSKETFEVATELFYVDVNKL